METNLHCQLASGKFAFINLGKQPSNVAISLEGMYHCMCIIKTQLILQGFAPTRFLYYTDIDVNV